MELPASDEFSERDRDEMRSLCSPLFVPRIDVVASPWVMPRQPRREDAPCGLHAERIRIGFVVSIVGDRRIPE